MDKIRAALRESLPFDGERVVFHTSTAFEDVLSNLRARVGTTPLEEIVALDGSIADFEREVGSHVGDSGFILFAEMDHGRWVERYGIERRLVRWLFGNPLIAITMLKHDLSAGLFVPVELLVAEAEDGHGCSVSYVVPSSLMSVDHNPERLAAAKVLDAKVDALIQGATVETVG